MNARKVKMLEKELDMVCIRILKNMENYNRKRRIANDSKSEELYGADEQIYYDWGLAEI